MSQVELAGSTLPPLSADLASGLGAENVRARGWSRLAALAACGALSLFALAALSAWQATGMVVPWDSKNQFYPFFRFMADGLARGDLPIWNPYHYGGHPSVADPQSLLFTPTMVLFGLLAPKASMPLFDAVIFAHLAAGGFGMLGLFARRGWHPAGAVLAGMIFMLGGVAAARLQHTGIIISYSFFPLALLALEIALARVSWIAALLFGLASALMLLGRDQTALLLAFALFGSFVFHVARAETPLAYALRRLPLLMAASCVVLAILVVPALLTLQFLADSNRPGIAYGVAAAGSLHPANLATFIAGNIFGSTDWNYRYWGPGYEATELADFTDRTINYLFAGSLPALLLLWHGVAGGRIFGRSLRYFAILLLGSILYALGRYTPVFGFLFDHVPGVALYRRPADAAFLVNIGIAVASGYLLHRYVSEGLPKPFTRFHPALAWTLALVTAGGVAWTIGQALAFAHARDQLTESLAALATTGLVMAGLAGALVFAARHGARGRAFAACALAAVAGGELVLQNAASSLNAEKLDRYALYDGAAPADRKGLDLLAAEIATANAAGRHPRVEILGLNGPWQNAAMVLGLENTLGYNPLRTADYARAVGPGENAGDPNLRQFPGTFRGYRCRLASLLGLEYIVLDRPLDRLPRHIPRPRAMPIYEGANMYVYRLTAPMPRAFLATDALAADREAILSEETMPEFERKSQALVDEENMRDLRLSYPRPAAATPPETKIVDYANGHVTLDVDSASGGVLVLHDIFYPGWRVRVDGEEQPILRANLLFRGVELGAGRHRVEFSYEPFSLANLTAAARQLVAGHEM